MKYWVYIHTFPNGKKYVGLTTQKNINKRWLGGRGYKGQVVYNPILKYGWRNIDHTVYQVDTKEEMEYLEKYLIAYYHTADRKYGYNVSTGGESGNGVPSKHRKAIDQYDRQGNFIRTWESLSAIEKELNYNISHISSCAKGERPTSHNCYWCYAGKKPIFKTRGTQRKVRQYDLQNNFIAEFKNAMEAAKSLGRTDNNTIVACCNKEYKTAYNYIWKYEC